MKILLVNNGFPSVYNPSYCSYIETIYTELKSDCGYDVGLLVIKPGRHTNLLFHLYTYIVFFIKQMCCSIKTYDVCYIHHPIFCLPLLIRLRLTNTNVVLHWHGNDLYSDTLLLSWLRSAVSVFFKRMYKHIVPSTYYSDLLKQKLSNRVQANNILISPSGGIDTIIFSPRKRLVTKSEYSIGFPSHLIKSKGVDYLIAIVKRQKEIEEILAKPIRFHVIDTGYGEGQSSYLKILRAFDSVIIHNPYCHGDMYYFYQSVDVVLMFSEHESLGLVALEAMSCNVPVIANDIAPLNEFIIPNVTGELIRLAGAVDSIMLLIRMIVKIGTNSNIYKPRDIVTKEYSKMHVVKLYKDFFHKLE